MYHLRYYAIGHSYLRHGPFPGWQTDGFWGMAASAPEKDYFHRFQHYLGEQFEASVEALAENHSSYERRCVEGVTREDYEASPEYAHMKEVLLTFKPNVISVCMGGGNTVANDEESISLFFDVLYGMIAKYKRPDAVVVCPSIRKKMWEANERMAKKHGLIPMDVSMIHNTRGYENPYHAFRQYPAYDEQAAAGAVEFRTHPGDEGHDLIASIMIEATRDAIARQIAEGPFEEEYSYKQYLEPVLVDKFRIITEPELFVNFYGFNLRQLENGVTFGSAPGTGASIAVSSAWISSKYNRFYIELAVNSTQKQVTLNATFMPREGEHLTLTAPVVDCDMHRYEFDLSSVNSWINGFRVYPDTDDCVLTVRALGFLE